MQAYVVDSRVGRKKILTTISYTVLRGVGAAPVE